LTPRPPTPLPVILSAHDRQARAAFGGTPPFLVIFGLNAPFWRDVAGEEKERLTAHFTALANAGVEMIIVSTERAAETREHMQFYGWDRFFGVRDIHGRDTLPALLLARKRGVAVQDIMHSFSPSRLHSMRNRRGSFSTNTPRSHKSLEREEVLYVDNDRSNVCSAQSVCMARNFGDSVSGAFAQSLRWIEFMTICQGPRLCVYQINQTLIKQDVFDILEKLNDISEMEQDVNYDPVAWFGGEKRITALSKHFKTLRNNGVELAIFSEPSISRCLIIRTLKAVGLAEYFEASNVLMAEDLGPLKDSVTLESLIRGISNQRGLLREEVYFMGHLQNDLIRGKFCCITKKTQVPMSQDDMVWIESNLNSKAS